MKENAKNTDIITDMEITMGFNKATIVFPLYLASAPIMAFNWNVSPDLNLTQSYSDNIVIQQQAKESSWVTQITPGLHIKSTGKHLNFFLNYQITDISYQSKSQLNDTYDHFNSKLQFSLFNNKWLTQISASKGKQVNNLSNGIRAGKSDFAINRTDISDYLFSSKFDSVFTDLFAYHLSLQANKSHSSDNQLNSDAIASSVTIENPPETDNSYWNISANNYELTSLQYSKSQYIRDYQASVGFKFYQDFWFFIQYFEQDSNLTSTPGNNIGSSNYGGGLRWFPSNKIDIKIAYNESLDDRYSNFYSLEINLKPSQRTQLYLVSGKRFYGNYFQGQFSYRLKRLSANISYNEQISSYSLAQFSSPISGNLICPNEGEFNLSNCLFSTELNPTIGVNEQLISATNFLPELNYQTYLDKHFNANISYTKRKLTLFLSHSRVRRTPLETDREKDERYSSFNIDYQISRRANIDFALSLRQSKVDSQLPTASSAQDRIASLGYSHRFSRLARAKIQLSHLTRDGTGSLLSYDENRISFSLVKEF